MTNYQKYLRLMNLNKKNPLPECTLKAMWNNWVCNDEDKKHHPYYFGINQGWRERQLSVMKELGIKEEIKYTVCGDHRVKPIKFTDSTKHLFATCQNLIMSKAHFNEYSGVTV